MTALSKLNQESEEYDFYLEEKEYTADILKDKYTELISELETVVKYEERLNNSDDDSILFWMANYYGSVSAVFYHLDSIQYSLKELDKLENKLKEAF